MNFVAIDVETANPDFASICQVGVAAFRDGTLHDTWESLVDPEDYFDEMNVAVHGIDERAVRGAPKWQIVYELLAPWLQGRVVASHTPFDRAALSRACEKNGLPPHNCTWLDTARVVRRAWPAFAQKGYGLANVTKHLNIQFQHHNAKEDARAAGEVLLRAMAETGFTVEQWLDRTAKPINPLSTAPVSRTGNPDGPLFGEKVVFTGALSMPRREAADLAAAAGCEVDSGVTKHTTVLVVGDQDIARLSGHERSSKHRKAEELMAQGQGIRIIGESDFRRLLALPT
ncbi:MAG: transposase [Betaproteobacteria bacterium RIFCSPLOWO2_12_FULL_62_58]|nr:MAG: transposase [Betaproteobacteria bacterium RIFCSPLOWO2_12_FULL_62_58]